MAKRAVIYIQKIPILCGFHTGKLYIFPKEARLLYEIS